MRPTVVHVITALRTGGAERMLARLLESSDALRRETKAVITLVPGGALEAPLSAMGVNVRSVGLARGQVSLAAIARLGSLLNDSGTCIVHAWMYHANIAASLAVLLGRRTMPVIWNMRHALHAHRQERRLTAVLIRAGVLLSWQPRRIVYNSATSRRQHAAIGYRDARAMVIPNGFVLPAGQTSPAARVVLRRELGLPEEAAVVGVVARFDPLKDFGTLFAAFRQVAAARPGARLVIAGEGASWDNPAFARLAVEHGVGPQVLPLGPRDDVERVFAAFDVAVSSSLSEAFPNAVGEAMAAGIPPVVTDVGDCRLLVGDAGRVVPPRDPSTLATAICEVLELSPGVREALGARARELIATRFSIEAVARQYEELYADVAAGG